MSRQAVVVLLMVALLAASGCGGSSTAQRPPSTPTPSPTPSVGSVVIKSISPPSAVAGSPDLALTITGSNLDLELHPGSPKNHTFVIWSQTGEALNATVLSSTQLTVVIPASLLANPVTAGISVQKWFFQDETPFAVSNSLSFSVTVAPAASIEPAAVTLGPRGTQQFVATVGGKSAEATWSVEEGEIGGHITSAGLYTVSEHPGAFHVVATLVADRPESATATVNVVASGFTPTVDMHVARSGHTATLLKDGKVLVIGGGSDTAEVFDPASGSFSLTGPLVAVRSGASATLLSDGRVLVSGGFGSASVLNTAEIFDPATSMFSPTGSMQLQRWGHTATLLSDGRVLIAGGYKGLCSTASAEVFDPSTGTFSSALLLSGRVFHTATLLKTGEVLLAGGSNGCRPDFYDDPPWDPLFVELFEPDSKRFQAGGNMSTTRIGHVAIRLADGRVLVLGGVPTVQNLHEQPPSPSYAELYDPFLRSFSPVAGLTISQARYTATLLNSGLVLVVGGTNAVGEALADVELLNPTSAALSFAGSLGHARVWHTATLLRDGRVLVTGGTDSEGNALASAEIYQ